VQELAILGKLFVAEEQLAPPVPEDAGRLVQAVFFDLFPQIRPLRSAAPADTVPLVKPPELEAAESVATVITDTQDPVGVQKLLDLPFVVDGDPFHGCFLHEESVLFTSVGRSWTAG
jgi:hypothetical protein